MRYDKMINDAVNRTMKEYTERKEKKVMADEEKVVGGSMSGVQGFEFNNDSVEKEMTEIARGKTIKEFKCDDSPFPNPYLLIMFTDGSRLELEYGWIYEWKYIPVLSKIKEKLK